MRPIFTRHRCSFYVEWQTNCRLIGGLLNGFYQYQKSSGDIHHYYGCSKCGQSNMLSVDVGYIVHWFILDGLKTDFLTICLHFPWKIIWLANIHLFLWSRADTQRLPMICSINVTSSWLSNQLQTVLHDLSTG